jgi:hypothetical protein
MNFIILHSRRDDKPTPRRARNRFGENNFLNAALDERRALATNTNYFSVFSLFFSVPAPPRRPEPGRPG